MREPITWDDFHGELTNGQHRLCALRGAGVDAVLVAGAFLSDTDYGEPCPASVHARQTIAASWARYAAESVWPRWLSQRVGQMPKRWRELLLRLNPPMAGDRLWRGD